MDALWGLYWELHGGSVIQAMLGLALQRRASGLGSHQWTGGWDGVS